MAKMREYDRLVMLLAKCLKYDGLSQKEAEAIVREHAETESKRKNTLPLLILRSEWERLKNAKAHRNINQYVADGLMPEMDFEEFEETKGIFKQMYRNVRKHIRETRRNNG